MKETRLVSVLIYLSIFVSSITFFKEPFEGYFHYLIFLVLLPPFMSNFGFPRQAVALLGIPLLVGILEILMGNNTWALFFKIFIGVLLSASFYYYVILYYEMDTEKMFRYYLKGAVIVCYIGLVQFVSYIVHFTPGYNYAWILNKWAIVPGGFGFRVNSIFSEASQFAIVISPACFVAIHNLIPGTNAYGLTRVQSIIVLVTLLLTTSTTGYIGLFVILFLFVINYGQIIYFLIGIVFTIFGANLLYNNVPEFKARVDTSIGLWVTNEFSVENINSSSFVLYNNYYIAVENFKSNFITGTGLGSHPIAFDKYSLTNQTGYLDIHFNKADGNSLLIRLISETGLIGVIFMFIFIRRNFIRRNPYDNENPDWVISNAILVIIILYLLRQGNYFLNGFPFFMWLYYFVRKEREQKALNAQMKEEDDEENEEEQETKENKNGESITQPRWPNWEV
jgi:hypothetical protein